MNTSNPFAVEFLQYNRWANLHLIDALLALTPEQLASSAPARMAVFTIRWCTSSRLSPGIIKG